MKLFYCALLLLAVTGSNCAPVEDEFESGERKYGLGIDVGGSYKGGLELGVRSQNGAHSVFADKSAAGKVNAGVGVYRSVKSFVPRTPYYPYPVQYDLRYPTPIVYNPYTVVPQNDSRFPLPQYSTYPIQYPYNGPQYIYPN